MILRSRNNQACSLSGLLYETVEKHEKKNQTSKASPCSEIIIKNIDSLNAFAYFKDENAQLQRTIAVCYTAKDFCWDDFTGSA